MTTAPRQPPQPTPLTLPAIDGDWSGWLQDRGKGGIERAREIAERLRGGSADSAVSLWNDLRIELSNTFVVCSLMSQVHPAAGVRAVAEAIELEASAFDTDLRLDRDIFDALVAIDPTSLDQDGQRFLSLTLRDFRRAGVDRDAETRDRLRELAERETELGQQFGKNIRDDVRTITVTTAELDGLPADYIAAHPAGTDGVHTLTTDYPDSQPFLAFATDAAARRRMYVAFLSRAWPDNDPVLLELLAVRAEHADLLGYAGWPDFDAEVKMIGSGDAIGEFIERITEAADASGRRDREVLLNRLRQVDPDATTIDRADVTHYAELVRREQFEVDAQETRAYFAFEGVRQGLLDVTGRLFGLTYTPVADAQTWHEDVACYDVALDGEALGRIYLDLHPREGKYKHAAQFTLTNGVAGRQLPEGVLVCNFPRGLMEHTDVVTLFHEFGHLVHHVLGGRQSWVRFSGVATEWDFVEAPSQLLEEWAWDPEILATFARNEAGEPIPAALVERMRRARDFGRGYQARTQMFYASVSYQLHRGAPEDLTETVRRLQTTYDLFPFVEDTHFHAAFGHLSGYTSGYYTYMWSLVIAKDLLTGFDRADLMNARVAHRYRDLVLSQGGRKDAADLIEDFLGRPYSFDAFERWLNG